jgi:uncharacterized protein
MLKRIAVLLALALPAFSQQAKPSAHPNVRAITAFVKLDRTDYEHQLADTIKFLRAAKDDYVKAGWNVQTVRITTQPFSEYTRGLSRADAVQLLDTIDAICAKEDVDLNVGPAVVRMSDSLDSFDVLGDLLVHAKKANASAIVANEDGINWKAIRAAAKMLKFVAENSPHSKGTFNFATTSMLKPGSPFYPGSYHLGNGKQFAIGIEGARMVTEAFSQSGYDPAKAKQNLSTALAREITQAEAIAKRIATRSTWEYLGMDPTAAPGMNPPDSIGAAIEKFTGSPLGSPGTMTAVGIITEATKSVPVKQVGYAGLMLPVLEDSRIAQRWSEGTLHLDTMLSYSAICATGLDTVPLPGDVTEEQIARIYGDVASLAYKWKKPLAARLQPVEGRKAGEMSDFDDPFLTNARLQALP